MKRQMIFWTLVLLSAMSCRKYLDAKPDTQQAVPATLQDAQALLDNVAFMNRSFPNAGEAASDNYYVTDAAYPALSAFDRDLYAWNPRGAVVGGQWNAPYRVVNYANLVLETPGAAPLRGAALFFRGYALLQLAGIFAPAYDPRTAGTDPGLPLRLTADFNPKSVRASNAATYRQILSDLRAAAALLPETSAFPSRPVRAAAWAALARTELVTGDYAAAGRDADSCLAAHPALLDLNGLNAASPNPFSRFNAETIFYALSSGGSALNPATARVDTALYASYAAGDLRRALYFRRNPDGSHSFKGNYDGAQSASLFSGPCSDELYLVSAECHARLGEVKEAMDRLNALLVTRYAAGSFVPLAAGDADTALALVLAERRKELVFRGLRWADLKRLNREERFRVTLRRSVAVGAAALVPGDLRYALLIPQQVISATGMPQNAR